jgi:hypothetical protein
VTRSVRLSLVSLTSGSPWNLSCTVEPIGPDCICRIHGGDAHVGAVALSQWRAGQAFTEAHTVQGHKETSIAVRAAREICTAWRGNTICIAGIHFDGITRAQIDEITQATYDLMRRAAKELEDRRRT